MKKRVAGRKFSRTTNQRKQLFRSLMHALVKKGSIVTSEAKAKSLRIFAEKLVTKAKKQSLAALRQIIKATGNLATARQLMQIGAIFKNRPGGYTRIIKLGTQTGDNSLQVRLEWVEKLPDLTVKQAKKDSIGKKTDRTKITAPSAVKADKSKNKK